MNKKVKKRLKKWCAGAPEIKRSDVKALMVELAASKKEVKRLTACLMEGEFKSLKEDRKKSLPVKPTPPPTRLIREDRSTPEPEPIKTRGCSTEIE